MATEQQIAANRANDKKSTGLQTPEGRAAVRLNSLKHGLSAETIVVTGEDPNQFEALQLAAAAWRQLRLFRMEAGFYRWPPQEHAHKDNYKILDKYSRLAYLAERDAADKQLRRCRADRRAKTAKQTQSHLQSKSTITTASPEMPLSEAPAAPLESAPLAPAA